ncbi:MAG: ABC transporter permease [Bacteroidales bacterium]|nr:ABC transporter permease [Bacteroidales bacterium]
MRKFAALLYKDLLLLVRDKAGLLFLFAMPMVLVLVMTGIQDGAVENSSKKTVSVLILDKDRDEMGREIISELQRQDLFDVTLADSTQTASEVQQAVKEGSFLIGVYIPENISSMVRNEIESSLSEMLGLGSTPQTDTLSSLKVFIDPTVNNTFRTTMMCYLREASNHIEKKALLSTISETAQEFSPFPTDSMAPPPDLKPISIDEIAYSKDAFRTNINVTEHNVPAWTLFAIFFIVISLSGGIIKERQDGSFSRLMAMTCPYSTYLMSKIVVYECVCVLQFLLVMMMGKLLFPLVGLPVFSMHGAFALCLMIVFFCALAAIGIGLTLGTFASTHQQASVLGAVTVVVLSAVGGIWVPTFLMPPFLKAVSVLSPLNWGIEAFYNVILRDGGIRSVLPNCLLLLALTVACTAVSIVAKKKI